MSKDVFQTQITQAVIEICKSCLPVVNTLLVKAEIIAQIDGQHEYQVIVSKFSKVISLNLINSKPSEFEL